MQPLLQYRIPYPNAGVHSSWHVIITDDARHFYYNTELARSLWQLADIQLEFPVDSEDGVNVDKLALAIDFDAIALLMSKARGLNDRPSLNSEQDKLPAPDEQSDCSDESSHSICSNGPDATSPIADIDIDTEARDLFISSLISDEGPPSQPHKSVETERSDPPISAILGGYSSSGSDEDDSEGENENGNKEKDEYESETGKGNEDKDECEINTGKGNEDTLRIEVGNGDKALQHKNENGTSDSVKPNPLDANATNNQEDGNQPLNLDLELSENESPESSHTEFMDLLSTLKTKINTDLPWALVEEDLMTELVQCPEYFAVSDSETREHLYNEWCARQDPVVFTSTQTRKYPTVTIEYLRFLQQNKADVKRLFYRDFQTRMSTPLQAFESLGEKRLELLFRQFKIMIVDFAAHEKRLKAGPGHDPAINLKRLELEKFLESRLSEIRASLPPDPVRLPDGNLSDFQKWMDIANCYLLPALVVESATNFIVGDEKRLACYQDILKSCVN